MVRYTEFFNHPPAISNFLGALIWLSNHQDVLEMSKCSELCENLQFAQDAGGAEDEEELRRLSCRIYLKLF